MAEQASLIRQVDVRLQSVARRIEALRVYHDAPGIDRQALAAEWPDTLDRLGWLDDLARQGRLLPEQLGLYRLLLQELVAQTEVIRALGIQLPTAELSHWLEERPESTVLVDSA